MNNHDIATTTTSHHQPQTIEALWAARERNRHEARARQEAANEPMYSALSASALALPGVHGALALRKPPQQLHLPPLERGTGEVIRSLTPILRVPPFEVTLTKEAEGGSNIVTPTLDASTGSAQMIVQAGVGSAGYISSTVWVASPLIPVARAGIVTCRALASYRWAYEWGSSVSRLAEGIGWVEKLVTFHRDDGSILDVPVWTADRLFSYVERSPFSGSDSRNGGTTGTVLDAVVGCAAPCNVRFRFALTCYGNADGNGRLDSSYSVIGMAGKVSFFQFDLP